MNAREEIIAALGADAVASASCDTAGYEQGARYGDGRAALVVFPRDTSQVRAVIAWARRHALHLVTQGANTNLVGAATPDTSGSQVIVSLTRMRDEIQIDVENRSVVVSAGVTLSSLNERLAEVDLCFPVDLGADPTVGGMIAMNTGGARLLRYGNVRRNLLGLEIVLADDGATVLNFMSALRKNNSGVDLKQNFIGSSGAFGIITRAILEVSRRPVQRATALLVPRDHFSVSQLLRILEAHFGDFLCSFEGISRNAIDCVLQFQPQTRNPFSPLPVPSYCVLVELCSTSTAMATFDLQNALDECLGNLLDEPTGPLQTAVLGDTDGLWRLRHGISESLRKKGHIIAFDISMPRSALSDFRKTMIAEIATRWPFLCVCDFGHFGDGGDHFNIVWPFEAQRPFDLAIVSELRHRVYARVVHQHRGSISAEHGIGPFNQSFYHAYTDEKSLRLSSEIKGMLDPQDMLGVVDFGTRDSSIIAPEFPGHVDRS